MRREERVTVQGPVKKQQRNVTRGGGEGPAGELGGFCKGRRVLGPTCALSPPGDASLSCAGVPGLLSVAQGLEALGAPEEPPKPEELDEAGRSLIRSNTFKSTYSSPRPPPSQSPSQSQSRRETTTSEWTPARRLTSSMEGSPRQAGDNPAAEYRRLRLQQAELVFLTECRRIEAEGEQVCALV